MEGTTKQKKMRSMKAVQRTTNAVVYVILIVISVIWLIPFVFLIMQSLRGEPSTGVADYFFPKHTTLLDYFDENTSRSSGRSTTTFTFSPIKDTL